MRVALVLNLRACGGETGEKIRFSVGEFEHIQQNEVFLQRCSRTLEGKHPTCQSPRELGGRTSERLGDSCLVSHEALYSSASLRQAVVTDLLSENTAKIK